VHTWGDTTATPVNLPVVAWSRGETFAEAAARELAEESCSTRAGGARAFAYDSTHRDRPLPHVFRPSCPPYVSGRPCLRSLQRSTSECYSLHPGGCHRAD
jgi:hypothetical protein